MLLYIIFAVIVLNPGISIKDLGKWFGQDHSWAEGKLMKMENQTSLRVSEDNQCRLYPYSRNGQPSVWLIQAREGF